MKRLKSWIIIMNTLGLISDLYTSKDKAIRSVLNIQLELLILLMIFRMTPNHSPEIIDLR
jgi:hypothetical protein